MSVGRDFTLTHVYADGWEAYEVEIRWRNARSMRRELLKANGAVTGRLNQYLETVYRVCPSPHRSQEPIPCPQRSLQATKLRWEQHLRQAIPKLPGKAHICESIVFTEMVRVISMLVQLNFLLPSLRVGNRDYNGS